MIFHVLSCFIKGPRRKKTCLRGFANNTGADQHLISAFVIRFLESNICERTISEISFRWLVSVAEETGFKLALSDTPKTGFVATGPKFKKIISVFSEVFIDVNSFVAAVL